MIARLLVFALFLAPLFSDAAFAVQGFFGINVNSTASSTISQSAWKCLNQTNVFAIIQGWDVQDGFNSKLLLAAERAEDAGFGVVDVYSFMCPQSGNGVAAVREFVGQLSSTHVPFGRVWMKIMQGNNCWDSDLYSNCAWLGSLVAEYERLSVPVGIFSSNKEWNSIVGSCGGKSDLLLWYSHFDGNPNYSDWPSVSFGGWKHPTFKQFAQETSCGVTLARNWIL